jgi:hypothetical protein
MKKFIPAPIKETLKFHAEDKADTSSSTSQSKTHFVFPSRNVKIDPPGVVAKTEDKALGVVERVPGKLSTIIKGNHPRSQEDATDAYSEV